MKYRIFQVNLDGNGRRLAFMPYDMLPPDAPNPAHYTPVYEGTVDYEEEEAEHTSTLENLFNIFNTRHPKAFTGRSMSISDVVELTDRDGTVNCYYVNTLGFQKVIFLVQSENSGHSIM